MLDALKGSNDLMVAAILFCASLNLSLDLSSQEARHGEDDRRLTFSEVRELLRMFDSDSVP